MSSYYLRTELWSNLPTEIWSNIKSYLLLDKQIFNILKQLADCSVTKLLENFKFEPNQIKIIKNTKINILSRKKFIIKILLTRCRCNIKKNEIQVKLTFIYKNKIENLEWRNEYIVGEQVLCYDFIIFENRKKSLQRKGVVVKIGLKSVSVKFYKFKIHPKNAIGFCPVEWLQEFEHHSKLIFQKMFIQKNEPYYANHFVVGRFYNF